DGVLLVSALALAGEGGNAHRRSAARKPGAHRSPAPGVAHSLHARNAPGRPRGTRSGEHRPDRVEPALPVQTCAGGHRAYLMDPVEKRVESSDSKGFHAS